MAENVARLERRYPNRKPSMPTSPPEIREESRHREREVPSLIQQLQGLRQLVVGLACQDGANGYEASQEDQCGK